MEKERELERWVASMSRGDIGFTYIRLYADAPEWVRNMAVNRFGKGTVFLPPAQTRPKGLPERVPSVAVGVSAASRV